MAMTSERNNYDRRKIRKRLLAALKDGTPCPRCGFGMFRGQPLDLGHVVARSLGGTFKDGVRLEHRWCSRSAGARLGNALRGRSRDWPKARDW